MTDQSQFDPAKADNSAGTQAPVQEPVTSPVASTDNDVAPEKKEELSRKLHSSKEEALRLKAENERLAQEKLELEAKLSSMQSVNSTVDTPVSEQDVAYLKALGKKAGFAFMQDVEKPLQAIKQETYKERQQAQFNKFLETHPEYNKPGDEQSDRLFAAFSSELATYKEPTDVNQWNKLFEKAHRNISLNEQTLLNQGQALGQAKQNIAARAGGMSYGGNSVSMTQNLSPEQQESHEGFANAFPQYFKKK
jgi:hypothetical protein